MNGSILEEQGMYRSRQQNQRSCNGDGDDHDHDHDHDQDQDHHPVAAAAAVTADEAEFHPGKGGEDEGITEGMPAGSADASAASAANVKCASEEQEKDKEKEELSGKGHTARGGKGDEENACGEADAQRALGSDERGGGNPVKNGCRPSPDGHRQRRDRSSSCSSSSSSSSSSSTSPARPSLPSLSSSLPPPYRSTDSDRLERCGRWLLSIPRDDVLALQRTAEYGEFVAAFERLGRAHRKAIARDQREMWLMERGRIDGGMGGRGAGADTDDDDDDDDDDEREHDGEDRDTAMTTMAMGGTCRSSSSSSSSFDCGECDVCKRRVAGGGDETGVFSSTANAQAPCRPPSSHYSLRRRQNHHKHRGHQHRRRRSYSFLQHLAVDDVVLSVLSFLDCAALVRASRTCHRLRCLTRRSACQRTHDMAGTRVLADPMRMLRAKEQIEGVGPTRRRSSRVGGGGRMEGAGIRSMAGGNGGAEDGWGVPFVRVPMLGLSRRVIVTGSGDEEYNGVYFCTGSNGNGFLFTKPRVPERRVWGGHGRGRGYSVVGEGTGDDDGVMEFGMGMGMMGMGMGGVGFGEGVGGMGGNGGNGNGNGATTWGNRAFEGGGGARAMDASLSTTTTRMGRDIPDGEDEPPKRLLRCVIAKRFSNETILWYMSKEVESINAETESPEITQVFSFWAKLMVIGDATPDICRYPSQTSILSRNGDPAWQGLSSTRTIAPPVVELLD